jgi:hypothetical protein
VLLIGTLLTGCGGAKDSYSNYGGDGSYGASVAGYNDGFFNDNDFSTGGNYASYSSDDVYADYSYEFGASGKGVKKETVLGELEVLRSYAYDAGGYVGSVNNTYTNYEDMGANVHNYYSDTERKYKSYGKVDFYVYVEEDAIADAIDELEGFCKTNHLTVSTFNQTVTNYRALKVVDEYSDDYWEREGTITEEDLEEELRYSTLHVTLSYYEPRGAFSKFGMGFKNLTNNFVDAIGSTLLTLFVYALFLLVTCFAILFAVNTMTGGGLKAKYKVYKKHPEYFEVPSGVPVRIVAGRSKPVVAKTKSSEKVSEQAAENNSEEKTAGDVE